jgi:hypothetical protein
MGATDDVPVDLPVDEVGGPVTGDGDARRGQSEPVDLVEQDIGLGAVGGDTDQLEEVGILRDDLEGLGTDGSGAAELTIATFDLRSDRDTFL